MTVTLTIDRGSERESALDASGCNRGKVLLLWSQLFSSVMGNSVAKKENKNRQNCLIIL